MLSIGGPQERVARFSDSQVTKAPKFAEHLVKFLSDNGLDGIDIYWPYSNKQYFDMNFWKLAFAVSKYRVIYRPTGAGIYQFLFSLRF